MSRLTVVVASGKLVQTETETVVSIHFRSELKGERSRSKRCAFVGKHGKIFTKSLSGKLNWPSEERKLAPQNCMKL